MQLPRLCIVLGLFAHKTRGDSPNSLSSLFPDFDCRWNPFWDSFRRKLVESRTINEMLAVSEFITLTVPLPTPAEVSAYRAACPFGTLTLELLLAMKALTTGKIDTYESHLIDFQNIFQTQSFMYWMATEWPLLPLMNNEFFVALGAGNQDGRLACVAEANEPQIVDWLAFKELMTNGDDWFLPSFKYIFDTDLASGVGAEDRAMRECPLGFALVHAIKAMICANTESICFRYHVRFIDMVLRSLPIDVIAGSDWKLVDFLGHVRAKVVRHVYKLDFNREELVGDQLLKSEVEPWTASISYADFLNVVNAIEKRIHDTRDQKYSNTESTPQLANVVVSMTMVYGPKFTSKLGRFMRRASAVGVEILVVFCLDQEAWKICQESPSYGEYCIRGTPSILNKFTLPQVFLNAGFDVFWIDFDVFLFKNPLLYIDTSDAEVLTASPFAADCVCSGLVYLKATDAVREWWLQATAWMYRHSFEHDQKTVSAFLNAGERVAAAWELPDVAIPQFGYLEAGNRFISAKHVEVGGWSGDLDSIVIYHFLNGDSDDKASIRNEEAVEFYDDLMEAFYGAAVAEELFDNGALLPHHVSQELQRLLLKSRWDERPSERRICTGVVPVQKA